MASQALRLVPGSVILTAPRLVSLLEPSMTCKQTLPSISCWSACHFHSSPGSTTTAGERQTYRNKYALSAEYYTALLLHVMVTRGYQVEQQECSLLCSVFLS